MQANPFLGVGLHAVGAFSAASCYTPQKQTKVWSWEVYWISQATFAWIILPIVFAFLTIPNYLDVLRECPPEAMRNSFLLGVLYGVGGLSFGLGIRYIGFSLNYAIAIGISALLGTLVPLIWDPNKGWTWEIAEKFNSTPGQIILAGIIVSVGGIALCGWAGALREKSGGSGPSQFSFQRGVPLAILAGVLSSVFNFALIAGEPIAKAAVAADAPIKEADAPIKEEDIEHGASDLLAMNAIYPFSHGGAWVASFVWCMFLIGRNGTKSQFVRLPENGNRSLGFYYLMALLSGAFWYFQFFFYGMGHANMGEEYGFTSWALHMAMLILFSNFYGYLFREWEGASTIPKKVLHAGMAVIVASTLIITYGNYLGEQKTSPPAEKEVPDETVRLDR